MKIVVFDLDETLGYFTQFSLFWNTLMQEIQQTGQPATQHLFNSVFSLYPEFVRPNIMNVLRFIKKQKQNKVCDRVLVYTNNSGPHVWVRMLLNYFNTHVDGDVVDHIIHAFTPNPASGNACRTTTCKTYQDLINCATLPKEAEICFVDDMYYPTMVSRQVYYINVKPYYYNLSFKEMMRRFKKSIAKEISFGSDSIERMHETLVKSTFMCFLKSHQEQQIDCVIGKVLLDDIRTFLYGAPRYKIMSKYTQRRRPHHVATAPATRKRMVNVSSCVSSGVLNEQTFVSGADSNAVA